MAAPLETPKAKAFGHFRKRLRERYGINKIRYDEYQRLNQQITNGHKNHFVSRASNTKTWWVVDHGDYRILALYCTNVGGFLTCMPLGFLEGAFNGKKPKMRYLGLTEITESHHKLARLCGFSSKLVDVSPVSATVSLTERGAEHAQADRQAGTEIGEQGAEAAQLPGDPGIG